METLWTFLLDRSLRFCLLPDFPSGMAKNIALCCCIHQTVSKVILVIRGFLALVHSALSPNISNSLKINAESVRLWAVKVSKNYRCGFIYSSYPVLWMHYVVPEVLWSLEHKGDPRWDYVISKILAEEFATFSLLNPPYYYKITDFWFLTAGPIKRYMMVLHWALDNNLSLFTDYLAAQSHST